MEVMGEVEDNSHQMPKLTMKQRQEKLFEELDLSGLESWPPELVASAQSLLAKYHNIFSLECAECALPQTYMEVCAFLGQLVTTGDS